MGDRQAQEFWDQMWYWEKYEVYPGEPVADPRLVIPLGSQVQQAQNAGQQPDPEIMRRFDHSVGRIVNRLTNLLPRSGEQVDLEEFKHWLRFGLDPRHRGHDQAVTPIIDADSLVIFLLFVGYAVDFCARHGLIDLEQLWTSIQQAAQGVEDQHTGSPGPSRFGP